MMNSLNTKCVQDLRPLPELIQRRDGTNDEPGEEPDARFLDVFERHLVE